MNSTLRDRLLSMSDDDLLQECRTDTFRSTGPGGQHRNRTDTAVRLTLKRAPEVVGEADERRSQHQNRHQAIHRLRLAIALRIRCAEAPEWAGPWRINPGNPEYPKLVARVFDALEQHAYGIREAAVALQQTTGQFNRFLARDDSLWGHLQQERQKRGMKPLRK